MATAQFAPASRSQVVSSPTDGEVGCAKMHRGGEGAGPDCFSKFSSKVCSANCKGLVVILFLLGALCVRCNSWELMKLSVLRDRFPVQKKIDEIGLDWRAQAVVHALESPAGSREAACHPPLMPTCPLVCSPLWIIYSDGFIGRRPQTLYLYACIPCPARPWAATFVCLL
jgi:hypothetical protein